MINIFTAKNILKTASNVSGAISIASIGMLGTSYHKTGLLSLIIFIPLTIILWLLAANVDTKKQLGKLQQELTEEKNAQNAVNVNLSGLKEENKKLMETIRGLENTISILEQMKQFYETVLNSYTLSETLNQEEQNAIKKIQNHKDY
ncbi:MULTISPECIES: hypothetical protein [Lactiplantibacillus]|uniref:Uncharacterized protein n=2 Tax=Lactiplantibacillus pentosus TaxID=1589 RepID=A0AAW8WEE1_LACPE|nr:MULTISPECIES: hypothetical protein [Lactiplantibacillus]MBG1237864.1 hypothetical protein [Lactiplantibacillus plantarum subsp. plantarum]MBU7462020.1 hypothetical protein [Lactiplantibacillus pentosus]MBU7485183.1 hypothetical protein [Lactiplantibacillus sp. 30.2.29]MBU7487859.1 hypothetical protein [Lactiplantibacillus pentosus]MBU7500983.1 hypothetical protein [Lactiplantibacillus pentosus]